MRTQNNQLLNRVGLLIWVFWLYRCELSRFIVITLSLGMILLTSEQEFLAKVEELIAQRLTSPGQEPSLQKIAADLCLSKTAKRVRPVLCYKFARLLDVPIDNNLVCIAVAAEFVHAASLLHDDVIDESEKRRGRPTANKMHGNSLAVLSGNFVLTEALTLLQVYDRILTDKLVEVVRHMSTAAMTEIQSRGHVNLSLSGWRKMAIGKTGALFSWCGFATAAIGVEPQYFDLLWRIGSHVGLLFQMADDIKDFCGDNNTKDICRDIRNKEPSFPVIVTIEQNPAIRTHFQEHFQNEYLSEQQVIFLRDLVLTSAGFHDALRMMQGEIEAIKLLLAPWGSHGCYDEAIEFVDSFVNKRMT